MGVAFDEPRRENVVRESPIQHVGTPTGELLKLTRPKYPAVRNRDVGGVRS
jgi:hypothetical protein